MDLITSIRRTGKTVLESVIRSFASAPVTMVSITVRQSFSAMKAPTCVEIRFRISWMCDESAAISV